MKTFFIAFVLGIFVGSIVTAYFTNPEAFDEFLQDASEKTGVEKEDIDQFKEKAGELFQQGAEKGKELAKDTAEASVALAIKAKWKPEIARRWPRPSPRWPRCSRSRNRPA